MTTPKPMKTVEWYPARERHWRTESRNWMGIRLGSGAKALWLNEGTHHYMGDLPVVDPDGTPVKVHALRGAGPLVIPLSELGERFLLIELFVLPYTLEPFARAGEVVWEDCGRVEFENGPDVPLLMKVSGNPALANARPVTGNVRDVFPRVFPKPALARLQIGEDRMPLLREKMTQPTRIFLISDQDWDPEIATMVTVRWDRLIPAAPELHIEAGMRAPRAGADGGGWNMALPVTVNDKASGNVGELYVASALISDLRVHLLGNEISASWNWYAPRRWLKVKLAWRFYDARGWAPDETYGEDVVSRSTYEKANSFLLPFHASDCEGWNLRITATPILLGTEREPTLATQISLENTRSSMALTYCPNCRYELDEPLGWICWRTIRAPKREAPARNKNSKERAMRLYRDAAAPPDWSTSALGPDGDDFCGEYNSADMTVCQNPLCSAGREGGAKAEKHYRPACPHCLEELPLLENLEPGTFTICGPTGAGKTYYIVALHHWWTRKLGTFGLVIMPAMGRTVKNLFAFYRASVDKKERLPATNPESRPISFVWQILPARPDTPGMLLTLPDASGERQMTPESLRVTRHFHHSSGVIFLLDGLRIATCLGFEDELSNEFRKKSFDPQDHQELLMAMISELSHRLSPDELPALPIAVCVNKVDILCRLTEEWQSIMRCQPHHEGFFDYKMCAKRSELIQSALLRNGDTALVAHTILGRFANVMFFAMATIGTDAEPLQYRPQSVEDPFLWLLGIKRFVQVK